MNAVDVLFSILVVILAGVFIVNLVFTGMGAAIEGQCLECGYSDYRMHGTDGYCIRMENATEVVVPVEEACQR